VPFERNGEKGLAAVKWLLVVNGEDWICCNYYAVRRTEGYHAEVGRVVAEIRAPLGTRQLADAQDIQWSVDDKRAMRAKSPIRPDMVFFPVDLTDHGEIMAAIRAHARAGRGQPVTEVLRHHREDLVFHG
jgi:hypothetical protein